MVGAYHDYIGFYQKNRHLTSEAKERLKALIKRTRSDRDRFASDYVDWTLHEYDGRVRLNPVAREIFYRYCPFKREVREEMARKPLYADMEARRQNRTRKTLLKLESRKKRFERADTPLPEELAHYIEFLNS
jgi:hypothetical protein